MAGRQQEGSTIINPCIIPRSDHVISRSNVNTNALKVLYRLKDVGYDAYLVGGGVRDLLLGREPKDFDIATNAHPEEVKAQFRNCRLVGRRFRLAHVWFGRDVVEVATFRATPTGEETGAAQEDNGRILRDNVYGSLEEDAWRRDFTVNALYYNIRDFSVVDYTGGLEDLKAGVLRLIGDPERRYREDPVRMLRAVRFAIKLGFRIHAKTEAPIFELGHLLADIPPARLYDEVLKLFMGGSALQSYEMLRRYGLFQYLFPDTDAILAEEEEGFPHMFLSYAFANTDARIAEEKPVTPAFLFAALLWEPMRKKAGETQAEGATELQALQAASTAVVQQQTNFVSLPKRFGVPMREIWLMQPRLMKNSGRRTLNMLSHVRFRAAYDFLLLRGQAGEDVAAVADWWTKFQELNDAEREEFIRSSKPTPRRRRKVRRRKPSGVDNA